MDFLSEIFLEGIRLLAERLFEAEAEFLCGATMRTHSKKRLNYRAGYRVRSLRTSLGKVRLRVPGLRFVHARPSLAKRLNRLELDVFHVLLAFLWDGFSEQRIRQLIKILWTVSLSEPLLTELSLKMHVVLDVWRRTAASSLTEADLRAIGMRLSVAAAGKKRAGRAGSRARRQALTAGAPVNLATTYYQPGTRPNKEENP